MEPLADERLTLLDDFPPVSEEAWRDRIDQDLRGADFDERLVWHTADGIDVQPYYREDDRADIAHAAPLTGDGELVPVRQDIATPDLDDARQLLRDAVERGAHAIGIVPATPGRASGVPIQNVADFRRLLSDVDLTAAAWHLTGGRAALPLLTFLLDLASDRGVSRSDLSGSLDFDPLAEAAMRGAIDETAFDLLHGTLQEADDLPDDFKLLAIDARPYHDAGASAGQELSATIAVLSETMAQLTARGLDAMTVARRLHLIVPVGTSYFMEIAKLRALRLLVQQVLSAYGIPTNRVTPPIQATTSWWSETVYDPHVNMLRATTEAAAAIIAGADTVSVRPFDALFDVPNAFSHRIARNTPLVLQHEAYLHRVADPAAGSYYIEQLTDKLGATAWKQLQTIETHGGLLEALKAGTLQAQIAETRQQRLDDVAVRRRILLGTNQYPNLEESRLDDLADAPSPSPTSDGEAAAHIDQETPLSALRSALADGATLADAVEGLKPADATSIEPLPRIRGAEAFEALRLSTERYAETTGRTPLVFLLPVGKPAWRSARANFARNVFGCAGLAVQEHLGFDTPEDGADAALDAGADIV
ncbi:MAG: methylmalonyl-CoA mutase, partial [Bacteroidetes bacterium]|nr:methylmalonyl-CoA mutase [Bacteroidota bacterium]